MKPFEDIVTTRVCGIPAQIKVMIWPGYKGATERGLKVEPDCPTEVEIMEILDRNGRKARWLEHKLDGMGAKGWQELQTEVEEIIDKRAPEDDY